jgi:hypothetical protein
VNRLFEPKERVKGELKEVQVKTENEVGGWGQTQLFLNNN